MTSSLGCQAWLINQCRRQASRRRRNISRHGNTRWQDPASPRRDAETARSLRASASSSPSRLTFIKGNCSSARTRQRRRRSRQAAVIRQIVFPRRQQRAPCCHVSVVGPTAVANALPCKLPPLTFTTSVPALLKPKIVVVVRGVICIRSHRVHDLRRRHGGRHKDPPQQRLVGCRRRNHAHIPLYWFSRIPLRNHSQALPSPRACHTFPPRCWSTPLAPAPALQSDGVAPES